MLGLTLITPPVIEPVTLQEARAHLRIADATDDVLLLTLIKTARLHLENESKRAFCSQTWELTLDQFPGSYWYNQAWIPSASCLTAIPLPRPVLQSVTYIKYVDGAGVLQTLATSEYQVVSKSEPASVVPAYGKYWPWTRPQPEAVTVRYLAGWTSADLVPLPIKQSILLLIGHLYENREAVSLDGRPPQVLPLAVQSLLMPYTILEAA